MRSTSPASSPVPGLAERLRGQRHAVGLTVQGLATRLGVSRNTITNYEAARTVPSSEQLVRLADALGCDLLDLLTGGPEPAPVRLAFRAHVRLQTQGRWAVAMRRFAQGCRGIESLVGVGDSEPVPRYPLPPEGGDRTPLIEAAADQLRRMSRFPDLGAEHIVRALEALGCRAGFLSGERGLDGEALEAWGERLLNAAKIEEVFAQ